MKKIISKFKYISFYLVSVLFISEKATAQCMSASPSVVNIANDSVSLSWTAISGAVGYEYAVLPQAAAQPASGTATTATAIGAGSLPYGSYKAWLRTNCGAGGYSTWSSITFTIVCGAPALSILNIKDTSADILWSAISSTATYEYVVDQTATSPTAAGTAIPGTSVHAGSLTQGATYYAHVRTQCNSTTLSSWNDQAFNTLFPAAIGSLNNNELLRSISPNPFSDIITVDLGSKNNGQLTVTNILGSVIYTQAVTGSKQTINLSQQPAGLYIVRYSDNNSVESARIIKQ